jgi:hypothetical protein
MITEVRLQPHLCTDPLPTAQNLFFHPEAHFWTTAVLSNLEPN